MEIALFITCLTDTFYPRVGVAVTRVLEHLGHRVIFPAEQTCCGQPFWNNGYSDEARKLADRMIDVFADCETVVTPSGSCCAMVREYFPELFKHDAKRLESAKALAGKTYEFVEFLTKKDELDLKAMGAAWQGEATYHYSCHLRGLGMTNEAVELLQSINGLSHRELEQRDQCCGFGGAFAVKMSEISGAMVRDKVACIEKAGAATVVVNDAGCSMNIEGACRRAGMKKRFKHTAEIIAESLGLMEAGDG